MLVNASSVSFPSSWNSLRPFLSLFLRPGIAFLCLCLLSFNLEQSSSVSVSFPSTWTVFLLCFCLLSFNMEQSSSVSFPSTWNSLRPSLSLSPILQPGTAFLCLCLLSFNLEQSSSFSVSVSYPSTWNSLRPSLSLSPILQPGTAFLCLCLFSFNPEQSSYASVFDPCTPNIPFHPKQFLPPGSLPLSLSLTLAPKTYRTTT